MGVPERMGVALVEVEVSASVSFEIVKGVSEMGGMIDTVIDGDSWITPSSVGYFGYLFVLHKIMSGM